MIIFVSKMTRQDKMEKLLEDISEKLDMLLLDDDIANVLIATDSINGINPDSSLILNQVELFFFEEKYNEALEKIQEVFLMLDEVPPLLWYDLACIYYHIEDWQTAIDCLDKLIEIGYDEYKVYYLKSLAYYELDKMQDAVDNLEIAKTKCIYESFEMNMHLAKCYKALMWPWKSIEILDPLYEKGFIFTANNLKTYIACVVEGGKINKARAICDRIKPLNFSGKDSSDLISKVYSISSVFEKGVPLGNSLIEKSLELYDYQDSEIKIYLISYNKDDYDFSW